METPFQSPGARRVGRYQLLEELGRGAQGQVFLAEDSSLSRRVALKVLSSAFAPTPESLHRFHREASAASKLDHPGICAIYEAGESNGSHYIAMRYVEGETLAKKLNSARQAPGLAEGDTLSVSPKKLRAAPSAPGGAGPEAGPAEAGKPSNRGEVMGAVHLIESAARALHAAHEAGLIHRDIKPGNIMVTKEGEPVILDFGLARDETSDVDSLTQSGDLLGTPAYMSPEQLLASRVTLDRRTDIYSLGATLYECLTLARPYDAPTRESLYQKILAADLPDPTRSNPSIPRDLRVVLQTALEKDRDRRYRTALDFAEDLRRVRCYEPILARPAGPLLRFQRWTQRNPVLATVTLGIFLLLTTGLAVSLLFLNQVNEEKRKTIEALGDKDAALKFAQRESGEKEKALQVAQTERDAKGRALAEKQEALARAQGLYLSAQASMVASRNPGLSLLLGLEGADLHPGLVANSILAQALKDLHEAITLTHAERIHSARLNASGTRVLLASDSDARLCEISTGKPLAILKGATPGSSSAVFSPDEKKVLTLTLHEPSARLWDAASGRLLAILGPQPGGISQGAFSPDGARLALAGENGQTGVFDAASGDRLLVLKGHESGVEAAVFSPDGERILTSSSGMIFKETMSPSGVSQSYTSYGEESTARVWDARDGHQIKILGGHFGKVSAAFSRDGGKIATASQLTNSSGIRIWDARTLDLLTTLPTTITSYATSVEFSPDSGRLLTISNDLPRRLPTNAEDLKTLTEARRSVAHIWGLAGGEAVALEGHDGDILSAHWSPDGERVLTASGDSTARIWHGRTGAELMALKGHEAGLNSAEFSLDGKRVLTTSADRTVRIWDGSEFSPYDVLKDAAGAMRHLAFSQSGDRLFAASESGIGWVFDLSVGKEPIRLRRQPVSRLLGSLGLTRTDLGDSLEALFTPDGRKLLTVTPTSTDVWDSETGKLILTLAEPPALAVISQRVMAVSPDGRRLASARASVPFAALIENEHAYGVKIWDLEKGQLLTSLPKRDRAVTAIAWAADGERFLTFVPADAAEVRQAAGGQVVSRMEHQGGNGGFAAFSADGRFAALPESYASARIFDAVSGESVAAIPGHLDVITSLAFSPDGRRLLTASKDYTAAIWSSTTGEQVKILKGHLGPLQSATYSDDGRWIVTSSDDRTVRIWDAESGAEVMAYPHPGPVAWARISPDSRFVLSKTAARKAYRWPLDLVAEARKRKPRDLAIEERERYQVGTAEERLAGQRRREIADLIGDLEVEARTIRSLGGDREESQGFLADSTRLLGLLRTDGSPSDVRKALEMARAAARGAGPGAPASKNPVLLQHLAELQSLNGEVKDAVLTLESAAVLRGAPSGLIQCLERDRRRLLPDLASLASIDWNLAAPDVLIGMNERWRFFRGKKEPSPALEWAGNGFDEAGWEDGAAGFGYGSPACSTVLGDMGGNYTTVYLRRKFDLPDPGVYQRLFLSILVDDGCVIYVNGEEAGRVRAFKAGVRLPFDGLAEATAPDPLPALEVPLDAKLFRAGANLLAIQGLNHTKTSSDLVLSPALLGDPKLEAGSDRARFEKFLGSLAEGDPRRPYLEGRLLQRAGKPKEALAKLEQALAGSRTAPEASRAIAECLRAAGEPSRARARIREALLSGVEDDALWRLWFQLTFLDLKESLADGLASLPPGPGREGAGGDLRWALEELRSRGALRIRAGGGDYRGADGKMWGRDRFTASGREFLGTFTGSIADTADPALYQTERWFGSEGPPLPGYHIPLPPGRYRVTLHFAEIYFRATNLRVFDVLIEGQKVLSSFDPFAAGFATAIRKSFETEVKDGVLDIEFVHRRGSPKVSAVEVEVVK